MSVQRSSCLNLLLCHSFTGTTGVLAACSGDSNLGPHVCLASTSSVELSSFLLKYVKVIVDVVGT